MPNFQQIFDNAVDDGFGPSERLEPGKYTAEIVSTSVGTTKKGDPSFGFLFKDVASGGTVWMNQNFFEGNEKATNVFVRVMKQLGITGAMLNADAEAACSAAEGKRFKIKVVQNGDFLNVYVNDEVTEGAAATAERTPLTIVEEAFPEEAPAAPPVAAEGDDPWSD